MDAKIAKLFDDLVEHRLTAEQVNEVERALQSDVAIAEAFRQLLGVHLGLSERAAAVRAFSLEELRAITAVDDRFDSHLATKLRSAAGGSGQHVSRRWMAAFAIAMTAFIALAFWSIWTRNTQSPQLARSIDSTSGVAEFADGSVARVRRKIDCDWSNDRWAVATSASIVEGQLITLTKGLLVLEFKSGAEVTLNGPATLIATSGTAANLVKGEMSARVPPQARGFRVETHAGDFIDLGTEFGLMVAENGDVETHVFKGQVIAQPTAAGGAAAPRSLLETGDAWARPAAGAIETGIVAEPARFLLPLHEDSVAQLARPPVDRSLTLWYSAASQVQRDETDGVTEWGDNLVAGTARRENAWQVSIEKRPKWIARSIGGKPALRFDGYKGLVTEPVKLGPNQSSVIVFRVDGDVARELIEDRNEFRELGVQLLNLNGPPHSVVQINRDLSLEARVHLGFVRDKVVPVDVGLVRSTKSLDNNPHILAYSFDTAGARAQLYLDGKLVSETNDVPKLDATYAPRFVGSHYDREGFGFTGEISELLIYDSALAPAECRSISAWLGNKYDIAVDEEGSSKQVAAREK